MTVPGETSTPPTANHHADHQAVHVCQYLAEHSEEYADISAFVALADPASRAYHDKKIAQGKHHTQALLRLARRRADVLFTMLRYGTYYEPQPARSG